MSKSKDKTRELRVCAAELIAKGSPPIESIPAIEETIRASEARYRNLFANTPISIWEEDFTAIGKWLEKLRADGVRNLRAYLKTHPDTLKRAVELIHILDVNRATLDLLEAESKKEVLSKFKDLFTEETYQAFSEELIAIWEGRARFETEIAGLTVKGNRIDCILHWFAPKRSGRLDLSNVIIAFSDITALKKTDDEVRLLLAITRAIHEVKGFHSAVGVALDTICETTRWDYGEVWLPEDDGKTIAYDSSYCFESDVLREFSRISKSLTFTRNEGLPGRVWSSKKAEWLDDISMISEDVFKRRPLAAKARLRTALGVPLVDNGGILAVLVFLMFDKRSKDERMIGLISSVAAQLGTVLQRKKAEAALSESEERYRGLVQSSPDAIIVEQDGSVVFMNAAAFQLFGYTPATELRGLSLLDLFHGNCRRSVEKLFRRKRNFPGSLVEGEMLHKDGQSIDVEASFIRTTLHEKPAILAQVRDVTEKKALQKRTRRMERLSTLGEISANIAHEIRNPLGVISLNCSYLENNLTIPEKLHERIDDLKQSIARIENIIESIIDFARPVMRPKVTETELHAVLDSSLDMVRNDLKRSRIRVGKSYKADRSRVSVDINKMLQVFVNLFTNARDSMDRGGRLTIRTISYEDEIEVQVKDDGTGIAPENLDKIFEPYFTTKKKGTGLGMAIVERILEQHKARISVESKIDRGTTFTIRFPLAEKE